VGRGTIRVWRRERLVQGLGRTDFLWISLGSALQHGTMHDSLDDLSRPIGFVNCPCEGIKRRLARQSRQFILASRFLMANSDD
jgi:hypothetical protein